MVRSTTEHDFEAVEFSHRLTALCSSRPFASLSTHVIHELQGFTTEGRLPFPCSTYMRHLIIISLPSQITETQQILRRASRKSTQPRLQVYYRSQPMEGGRLQRTYPRSQRPAMLPMQIDIPHPGASRMRKRHATTCKPVQSPPDTLGKDLPPLRRDSCVRMLTGWKIDDLAFVAACGGVSIHQILGETVRLCVTRHHGGGRWAHGRYRRRGYTLPSPDIHVDNNANLHVWAACGRSGNQDSYRPTYMYFSTVACASPRPVVPLPHIYRAVMLIFDLVDIPVSPAADSPNQCQP